MKLVFASNNQNKIKEIKLLVPQNIEILSLKDIGCDEEIPETAATMEGNAILKANFVTEKYGYNCFADDSGLEVDFLDGNPGVYSARYAGEHRSNEDNITKILSKLENITNRKANFKTIICLNFDGTKTLFNGIINGVIATEKVGNNGFGYDPIFIPDGYNETFATMNSIEKSAISHRGIAVKKLVEFLKKSNLIL